MKHLLLILGIVGLVGCQEGAEQACETSEGGVCAEEVVTETLTETEALIDGVTMKWNAGKWNEQTWK